ncbi:DUF2510 domain-containing protein [Salinibacterium sp. SWN1162]|uniref:DUF2510 domain-containing protein n=1 Tax=Salinibacterium sp. SWN1162 TaxID=2792053 RepID=UPI0018CFBF8C|nr:DUF2510 domain-containing protein [Salinibacterium sp. SWN1162]MBH0009106.1 DUF2510 domain-containing protein [Salinibacterium sp. SWN1162]
MTDDAVAPPAGWYADPNDPTLSRWWSGSSWTEHYAPAAAAPVQVVAVVSRKDVAITYLLAIFLTGFAAHYFYLGRIGSAIGFLALWWIGIATAAIFIGIPLIVAAYVWLIVDLFLIPSYVRAYNAKTLVR